MTFLGNLNLDLVSVGIAIAGICILGFIVFFSNHKSITNKTFLLFALVASAWSVFNYLSYHTNSEVFALWSFRLVIFFAVWYCFCLFQLFYVVPEEKVTFGKPYKYVMMPIVFGVSLLTLTPLVFNHISNFNGSGDVPIIDVNKGIILFGITVGYLIFGGIVLLFRKMRSASGINRIQLIYIGIGALITFSLHLDYNFILPAFFNQVRYIPLGAIFTFPFVIFAAYAIIRHHLLNVKVIATELLSFLLTIAVLFEIIFSQSTGELIFRSFVFIGVLLFSILLIRSVLKEVKQREELEKLSHFKTQILSIVSHQLRSPLAAVKGFASLLLDGTYGKVTDPQKEVVGKMKNASDGLLDMVEDLLNFRKIEEGRMDYQFAPIDIVQMSKDIVEELRPLATEKKLALSAMLPPNAITVNADAPKLKQVILNLVDNAIKYTPSGFVKLEIIPGAGKVTVKVSDSGLGMAPSLIDKVFVEFVRGEGVKKEIRGTGLGLYIAKSIIEAHEGGRIWAESAGEGKGSTFSIELKTV